MDDTSSRLSEDSEKNPDQEREQNEFDFNGQRLFFAGQTIHFPSPDPDTSSGIKGISEAGVRKFTMNTGLPSGKPAGEEDAEGSADEGPGIGSDKEKSEKETSVVRPTFSMTEYLSDDFNSLWKKDSDIQIQNKSADTLFSGDNVIDTTSGNTSEPEESDDPEHLDFSFFARHFAKNQNADEDSFDKAFENGLQSVFQSEMTEEDLSESERFQKEEAEFQRENIDGVLRQADTDSLYELGAKYGHENPGVQKSSGAEINPMSILEAMLFVGDRENRALLLKRATELMRNVSELEAIEAIADLNERYVRNQAPYRIVRDGEGFRMILIPEYEEIRERFSGKTREFKLSQRAIDILAFIAYRQPVSLAEIHKVRPNPGNILTLLVKRNLIMEERKSVDRKQVIYFRTTSRFLNLFNISSLDDLPIVDEIDFR